MVTKSLTGEAGEWCSGRHEGGGHAGGGGKVVRSLWTQCADVGLYMHNSSQSGALQQLHVCRQGVGVCNSP